MAQWCAIAAATFVPFRRPDECIRPFVSRNLHPHPHPCQAYRGRAAGGGKADKKGAKFELTEEQKQEIREAFDLFDTDGSGKHEPGGEAPPSPPVRARTMK